jgi:SAM-dependent methyltransferase
MYGANYGYRSSLNPSMVSHLRSKVKKLRDFVCLTEKDLVLDLGSNDGTLLSFYPDNITRVGMDPTIIKFGSYYMPGIHAIPSFFSAGKFQNHFGKRKAKIITSIAMYYDLEDPLNFASDVKDILAADGIWHFEQSYLPFMLTNNSYDTVCHEHLEYYGLSQIQWIMEKCNLRILDVEFNAINGGSFAITVCHKNAPFRSNHKAIAQVLENEKVLQSLKPYEEFKSRVFQHRERLQHTLEDIHTKNKSVLGYGASTKGNVILQFCGLTEKEIPAIAEVNEDKLGAYTPGSHIPIISESKAHQLNPDFLLVMPWHFRANLVSREKKYLQRGGCMIFPLPSIEMVSK